MNIRRILCPVDFSEFLDETNEYASSLAKSAGAKIIFYHVTEADNAYARYAYEAIDQEINENLKKLKEIEPAIYAVDVGYVADYGLPSHKIVQYAKENNIDLIVMGTHGRTGLRRALMGSVAEYVVRNAPCPVLAVKSNSRAKQSA